MSYRHFRALGLAQIKANAAKSKQQLKGIKKGRNRRQQFPPNTQKPTR